MAKVKIADVAREAGVSLGTVSNALNHPDKVRADTLSSIQEAIDRLGYVPNQAARKLAGGEVRVFGLVLPRLDHAFSLQIANGAQAESRLHGYDLLIASAGNDDILTNHYMRYFLGAQVAGVLVQPMAAPSWKMPAATSAVPTVYLDVHGGHGVRCVSADNEAQGRVMLEHALECGASRVAVVGRRAFMQLALRVKGIEEAAARAGVAVEVIDRGDWNTAADGYELGRGLSGRPPADRPDFVIGLTDVLAAGVIDGVVSAGLKVPDDMLVAGCDGNPLAWGGTVALTTITSPGYEIGRRGVRALLAEIDGELLDDGEKQSCEPVLLKRASTAATKAAMRHAEAPGLNLGEYL